MDKLVNAIAQRCSRRKYLPTPLDDRASAKLKALIKEFRAKENLNMQLVLNNGEAFGGLRKSYGLFSGVRHYIVQIGDETDVLEKEKLGYYGELLVLYATARGLGTCWVGGTYDEKSCPVELGGNERIICSIVVGNVEESLSRKEKLIRWGTHRKTKSVQQMYTAQGEAPDWFLAGMDAVQKAPSAVNRQPAMFSYQNGVVRARVEDITAGAAAIDLGIAKLHFELGAGGGSWAFGNDAEFEKAGE